MSERPVDKSAALCPHGMPLAQNICGPCSEGRPMRTEAATEMVRILDLIDEYGRSSYEVGASDTYPLYDPGRHHKHEQRDSDKVDLLAAIDALRAAMDKANTVNDGIAAEYVKTRLALQDAQHALTARDAAVIAACAHLQMASGSNAEWRANEALKLLQAILAKETTK